MSHDPARHGPVRPHPDRHDLDRHRERPGARAASTARRTHPRVRTALAACGALAATALTALPASPAQAGNCEDTASIFTSGGSQRFPVTGLTSGHPVVDETYFGSQVSSTGLMDDDRLLGATNGYLFALDYTTQVERTYVYDDVDGMESDWEDIPSSPPAGLYLMRWNRDDDYIRYVDTETPEDTSDGVTNGVVPPDEEPLPILARDTAEFAEAFTDGSDSNPSPNPVTTDETGALYTVTHDGNLRRYVYDYNASPRKWTQWGHVIETGWNDVTHIVGAGAGIIYGITDAGTTRVLHFDRASDRVTHRKNLDSKAITFSEKAFSLGGERFFDVDADGVLQFITAPGQGSGTEWSRTPASEGLGSLQLTALQGACHASATPAPTVTNELSTHAPVFATQITAPTSTGPQLNVSIVDSFGQLINMEATALNGVSFSEPTSFSTYGVTGQPSAFETPARSSASADGKDVNVLALRGDGHVIRAIQSPTSSRWIERDEGGATTNPVEAVRLANGRTVLFTVIDGELWTKRQFNARPSAVVPVGVDLAAWMPAAQDGSEPTGPELRGTPTAVTRPDGRTLLVVQDVEGAFWTVDYQHDPESPTAPELSRWKRLSGRGFTGAVVVTTYPTSLMRVVARDPRGQVVTLSQDTPDTWADEWSAVGTGQPEIQGDPAAVFEAGLTRGTVVVALGTDGRIYASRETTTPGAFGSWQAISDERDTFHVPPTVYTVQNAHGQQESWGIITYSVGDAGEIEPVGFEKQVFRRVGGSGASVPQDGASPAPADDQLRFRRIEFPTIPAP